AADAFPLEERVRCDGRAVNEERDVLRRHARDPDDFADAFLDALRLVRRRRTRLREMNAVGRRIEQDEIRERPADVHSESDAHEREVWQVRWSGGGAADVSRTCRGSAPRRARLSRPASLSRVLEARACST